MGFFFAISMWTLKNYWFGFQSVQPWAHGTHAARCSPRAPPAWLATLPREPPCNFCILYCIKNNVLLIFKRVFKNMPLEHHLDKSWKRCIFSNRNVRKEQSLERGSWPRWALQTQSQMDPQEPEGFRVGAKDPSEPGRVEDQAWFVLTPP